MTTPTGATITEKEKTKGQQGPQEEILRVRITFKSRIVKPLETACRHLIQKAKQNDYKTRGPVRIPTKKLHITTRKAPSGEGTNTWDHFEMKIHKRVIDLFCPSGVIKELTNFKIDSSVDVHVNMFPN